ncbi:hypothetical protein [Paenarthrobacter sp. CAP02]|uniref:hypothetical protein n=1 Tax=Paenarthrobacter sp. CAP02 TaxID=3158144 RepID=UPI0032DAEDC4
MSRSRASAKAAGARHERSIADYLQAHVSRFIDRMPKYGAHDRGDVLNVETFNEQPVAIEAKDYGGRLEAGSWLKEAETERLNLGAVAGVVIAKRRGVTDPGRQIVLMEVDDLVALLTGARPPK